MHPNTLLTMMEAQARRAVIRDLFVKAYDVGDVDVLRALRIADAQATVELKAAVAAHQLSETQPEVTQ